ncbi:hypothetical protein BN946_scf184594.g14 [Trametes cinnabarina]|uniref:Uncharacterized protein n=1 Tax=Pycnoporus cinnabarinus TaxID=5643 RepID=A0A060SQU3_PYCCI|nr:hypothetical protein BN946_scf184594.g14 [Trametes cinnabarina]
MPAAAAVKQVEQQLEQLKKKVAEEEREARRQAEEAECKRQQEEAARKREEERAQARKQKAPESDLSLDSGEEVEQKPGLLISCCKRCREKGVRCTFHPGKRNSTCIECQRLKVAPCVGGKGLSDPELQAQVDRKAAAAAPVDPRK